MVKWFALAMALLILAPHAAEGADYQWPVVRVIDGDTVVVDASTDLPPELAELKVRLRGVDTPEKGGRAKCDEERAAWVVNGGAKRDHRGGVRRDHLAAAGLSP